MKPNQERRDFLFHSALVDMGPVRITVDGEVREIKKKDGNEQSIVDITVLPKGGAAEPWTLWIENAEVEEFFVAADIGVPFTVVADGSREEASVTDVGRSGEATSSTTKPADHGKRNQSVTPHDTTKRPPDAAGDKATTAARLFLARRVSLKRLCVKATMALDAECQSVGAPAMSPESFWSQVTNFYISVEAEGLAMRKGFADAMPTGLTFARLEEMSQSKSKPPSEPLAATETTKPSTAASTDDGGAF